MNEQEQKKADRDALKRGHLSIRRLQKRERECGRAKRGRFLSFFSTTYTRLRAC